MENSVVPGASRKLPNRSKSTDWPDLPFAGLRETCTTLHLWVQVVGKIRLVCTPWTNHSWHVPLYVTTRGLTTSPVPYGARSFEIDFDLLEHQLRIRTSDGAARAIPLAPRPVAEFFR